MAEQRNEAQETQEHKKSGNTGLPFGLCKKYGISLPENATPREAWEALKRKTGMSPEQFYEDLKRRGETPPEDLSQRTSNDQPTSAQNENETDESPKIGDQVYVAGWFKFDLPSYATQPRIVTIIGESASGKAWKVDVETETSDGERDLYFTKFVPKAAVKSFSQAERELQEAEERFKSGEKRYNDMIEFARKNGVKGVRVGLRKETILRLIEQAGFNYTY